MTVRVYPTKKEAEEAQAAFWAIQKQAMVARGCVVDQDGNVRGVNAATGLPDMDAPATTRWSDVVELPGKQGFMVADPASPANKLYGTMRTEIDHAMAVNGGTLVVDPPEDWVEAAAPEMIKREALARRSLEVGDPLADPPQDRNGDRVP